MGSLNSKNNQNHKVKNSITNISLTDKGHQKLKDVHSHIKDLLSKGGNKNDLTEIFFSLSYFFENYLLKEELFLKKTGYPNLENHSSSHKEFMMKIERLKDSVDNDAKDVLKELDNFIDDWLSNHEASYNDEMVNFLKKKGFISD
jgi:hemerythrin-like metal-binding protein